MIEIEDTDRDKFVETFLSDLLFDSNGEKCSKRLYTLLKQGCERTKTLGDGDSKLIETPERTKIRSPRKHVLKTDTKRESLVHSRGTENKKSLRTLETECFW